jgi:hypothetical protein
MRNILIFVGAALSLAISSLAFADASGPAWVCNLQSTELSGYTAAIGVSVTRAKGTGVVHCVSMLGRGQTDTPVLVSLRGLGAGLGYAHIKNLMVETAGLGVSTPNDLFGSYRLQAAVTVTALKGGASLNTYAAVNKKGLSVGVGVTGYKGEGLDVNGELETLVIKSVN